MIVLFRKCLAVTSLILCIGPCSALAAQQVETVPWAVLSGVVVRAGTTERLKKAHLELIPASVGLLSEYDYSLFWEAAKAQFPRLEARTDEEGRFSFAQVPPGRYRLIASRAGFVRAQFGQSASTPGVLIGVTGGTVLRDLVVALEPAGAITGTVRDEKGVPVVSASVQALAVQRFPGGGRRLRLIQVAETNDLGQFRLYWLSPGDYYVVVDYRESARRPMFDGVAERPNRWVTGQPFPLTFYPNTLRLDDAVSVSVTLGTETGGIDFELAVKPLPALRGRVTLPDQTSVLRSVQIMLAPLSLVDGAYAFDNRANTDGEFEIRNVAPGSYVLKGYYFDQTVELVSPAVRVDVQDKDLQDIVVPLVLPIKVTGVFQVEDTSGDPPLDINGSLVRFTGRSGRADTFDAVLSANGTFEDEGVAFPGEFTISMLGLPPGHYLKTATSDGQDLFRGPLQIVSSSPSSITLTIARHGGSVTGNVSDATRKPAKATVVLIPVEALRHRAELYLRADTDADGRFVLKSPPPGQYSVIAFDSVADGAYFDPAFIESHSFRAIKVEIKENQDQDLSLTLVSSGVSR